MGVDYSAYVGYGFIADLNSIPIPDEFVDDGVQEYLYYLYSLGIENAIAANYWSGNVEDFKVLFCVNGTLTSIDYDGENCRVVCDKNIDVDSILELQVKLENLGIEVSNEPSWYIVTTVC